ncbi:MAG TPA: hypothetical protein PLG31_14545 [Spirochaetota bacterium]|mgnify:FL=1|nr:hypothetical protein [Spirochaetota bacterium]
MNAINAVIDTLNVPPAVKTDLSRFIQELITLYREDLHSITAFGSSVRGEYREKTSDLNLLVVYHDLEIADLARVAEVARRWQRKRNFAPRFLSKRNLVDTARYFQVDVLHLKHTSALLFGHDILGGLPESLPDMRWQIAHETKKIRMRLKQQFWRTAGDRAAMAAVIARRSSSLVSLLRATLYLAERQYHETPWQVIDAASRNLGIDAGALERLLALKHAARPNTAELNEAFTALMNIIRALDAKIETIPA